MYVPRASQGLHIPRIRLPLLPLVAVVAAVAAWGAPTIRPIGHEPALPQPIATDIHSIAYFERAPGADVLTVRRAAGASVAEPVAMFPRYLEFGARGSASPTGGTVAVLSVGERPTSPATLTLVHMESGEPRVVPGDYGYLSPLAWAADGSRLGVLGFSAGGEAPVLVEVDVASATIVSASRFDSALEVAPVGFTPGANGMLAVVVDAGGSSLWSVRGGDAKHVADLSAGLTRDWSLSADGARLAFVERLGVGGRRYAGRVLTLATGTVQRVPGDGDQFGAVWQPGTQVAEFGGPGGSLRLAGGGTGYIVPRAWSPDGTTLVAAVFPSDVPGAEAELQVIHTDEWRMPLGSNSATFIGWVRDRE